MADRTLILADDLTGALDSAVGFTGRDRRVIVARTPAAVAGALAVDPDVLAINTASREVGVQAAVDRVRSALVDVPPGAFSVVMKKIDSRLKGHVAAESRVLADWAGLSRQVASPAIPAMGRRVAAGWLVGDGVVAPIPVAARCGPGVLVPEIASDADLDATVADASAPTLWIGARGLAFALARRGGVAAPEGAMASGPVMIANGSRDPLTLAQIAAIGDAATVVAAPDGAAPGDGAVEAALVRREALVLSMSDGGGGLVGARAAERFAATTVALAERVRPATLLICGGESAQATLDRLGIHRLQVVAELRPGLPLCLVETVWGQVGVVTKSGGFGAPGLLAEILASVRQG